MVKKIHILFPDLIEVIYTLDLHRFCFYPLAVFDVAALCGYFTDIDLGVKVSGKRITMIAAVAVKYINIVYFIKIMLLGICTEYACNTGIKA